VTVELERRFHVGDTFTIPPLEYRCVRGRKSPADLVLEWRHVGEWRPVELDHVAIIVDAIADNERELYPPPAAGGGKVYAFVRTALRDGWRAARDGLHRERAARDERRAS
jgi:hypothetical protein